MEQNKKNIGIFEDDAEPLIWENRSPNILFEDDFEKMIFDTLIEAVAGCTGIGSCIIGSTFKVG